MNKQNFTEATPIIVNHDEVIAKAAAANTPPSVIDGITAKLKPGEKIDIETVKQAVFLEILPQLARLANRLGYAWVGGVDTNFVGGDYIWIGTGETFVGSGNYQITGPAFAPNLKHGAQGAGTADGAGAGYRSELRTSFEFINVSVDGADSTSGDFGVGQGQSSSVTTFEVDNMAAETPVTSLFEAEIFTQSAVSSAVERGWSDDWHMDFSATESFSTGGKGAMFPSASFSSTESYGQNHAKSGSDSSSNSQTTGHTQRYSFTHETPAGYDGKYEIIADEVPMSLTFTANAVVRFGVKIHGFLRWGGGNAFQGDTNYHDQYSGSGERPTIDAIFGDKNTTFYEAITRDAASNAAPWAWAAMQKQHPDVVDIVSWMDNVAPGICTVPASGAMMVVTRNNVKFRVISEALPESA